MAQDNYHLPLPKLRSSMRRLLNPLRRGRSPSPHRESAEMETRGLLTSSEVNGEESSVVDPPSTLDSPPRDPFIAVVNLVGIGWTIGLFVVYPFPTTIPIFVGGVICLTGWDVIAWTRILATLYRERSFLRLKASRTFRQWIGLTVCTILVLFLFSLGLTPPPEDLPTLHPGPVGAPERYFIAADMYNNEAVFGQWSAEVLKLARHLGTSNTFISIFESNSWDGTKPMLLQFRDTLDREGIPNKIVLEDDEDENARWWPYGTAPERVDYLAKARNRAMEPLQSADERKRLQDYDTYTKTIFLNDVRFTYQSIVRLIDTRVDSDISQPTDYDLACAMDFVTVGLYDTWAARDVCGTPLRAFWPYVKDKASVALLRKEEPFPVAACWNGAVVFPTGPFLYNPDFEEREAGTLSARGWKMVDGPPSSDSRYSPKLGHPIRFRSSGVDACDHSECFLFSYDIHRLYNGTGHRPRIYMNPSVRVAYDQNTFWWQNTVFRIGMIRWWVDHWSRGVPLLAVNWIWEFFGRRRDYCTWAGLILPEHCPSLPGPPSRDWSG